MAAGRRDAQLEGEVTVASAPGTGTTFTVTVPAAIVDAEPATNGGQQQAA